MCSLVKTDEHIVHTIARVPRDTEHDINSIKKISTKSEDENYMADMAMLVNFLVYASCLLNRILSHILRSTYLSQYTKHKYLTH